MEVIYIRCGGWGDKEIKLSFPVLQSKKNHLLHIECFFHLYFIFLSLLDFIIFDEVLIEYHKYFSFMITWMLKYTTLPLVPFYRSLFSCVLNLYWALWKILMFLSKVFASKIYSLSCSLWTRLLHHLNEVESQIRVSQLFYNTQTTFHSIIRSILSIYNNI